MDASDDSCMFQLFKQVVHQTERNEFYCDGELVLLGNPGVEVDFRNVDHTYEVFALLGNYWGGWNLTPTAGEMYDIARKWEYRFDAEIIGLSHDSIDIRFERRLSDIEIDELINECRNLHADVTCSDGYEGMKKQIKEKSELHIWWD